MSQDPGIEKLVVAAVNALPSGQRDALASQQAPLTPPTPTPPPETYRADQISAPAGWDGYQCWTVENRVYLWDVTKDVAASTPRDQWQSPQALEAHRQVLILERKKQERKEMEAPTGVNEIKAAEVPGSWVTIAPSGNPVYLFGESVAEDVARRTPLKDWKPEAEFNRWREERNRRRFEATMGGRRGPGQRNDEEKKKAAKPKEKTREEVLDELKRGKKPDLVRRSSHGGKSRVQTSELARWANTSDDAVGKGQVIQKGQRSATLQGETPVLWTVGAAGCMAIAAIGASGCRLTHTDPEQVQSSRLVAGVIEAFNGVVGLAGAKVYIASTLALKTQYGKAVVLAFEEIGAEVIQYDESDRLAIAISLGKTKVIKDFETPPPSHRAASDMSL